MTIDLEKIRMHLKMVACPRDAFQNPETLDRIQAYIRNELVSYGYEVRPHVFSFEGGKFENLLAQRPGADPFPEFIVGAHFDSVPGTPGADDNASGIAALLEAARHAVHLPVNCLFAAFNLEEYGMRGSMAFAESLAQSMPPARKAKFLGMISLEMVGYSSKKKDSQMVPEFLKPIYPSTGDFLALVGDNRSASLIKTAEAAFSENGLPVQTLTVPLKGIEFPAVRLSDHSPFWDKDFPALLVTDTSFFRNPFYHTPADTIETLDLDFLQKTAGGVVRLLQALKSS